MDAVIAIITDPIHIATDDNKAFCESNMSTQNTVLCLFLLCMETENALS